MIWILRSANSEVTDYYIETVAYALEEAGYKTKDVAPHEARNCVNKIAASSDWFLAPSALEACKLYLWGAKNIILWSQGVVPEESYLRNRSRIRMVALSLIERYALNRAALCLFVSDEMRRYYEKKYKINFDDRCFIMPCFNTMLDSEAFHTEAKYDSPTFAYVGSLAAWQCFDETVDLYKAIESRLGCARFKVLTFNQDEARKLLEKKGVRHYEIGCVPPEKVAEELADVSYGFVIREDNIVNRVATPTKISSYMASGVIPIFSSCLRSFSDLARDLRFAVPVGESLDVDSIVRYCENDINWKDVLAEYRHVFETYYSRVYYVKQLVPLLRKIINEGNELD